MLYSPSPTTVLPALATFQACSAARVGEALQALCDVYFLHIPLLTPIGTIPALKQSLSKAVPSLRLKQTARLVHHYDGVPDSGYASAEEDESEDEPGETRDNDVDDNEALDMSRSDELERGYAIKWLTGIVKRGDAWVSATPCPDEQEARTTRLEDASRLLARFAGDDGPEEALTRTFVFPFRIPPCRDCRRWHISLPAPPITVELNDAPVDGTDHTAVGLQSWGSAIVFAERMCSDPERYLGALHPCSCAPATTARPRRLLELGAGTGLLSIAAAQIFSRTSVSTKVHATDYHPSVLENLARNVRHNGSAVSVSVEKLDWCAMTRAEDGAVYDVVLAADVIYYPEHARWIRGCVERTLREDGVFWLIIPVRTTGRHEALGETVEEAFPVVGDGEEAGLRLGRRLVVVRREGLQRMRGVGRADEGGYTLFEIRWV